jgi:O-antigen/teichoic acid export membrane protein
VTHLQRGVLQGTQAFGRYGLSAAFEGIVKVAIAAATLLFVARSETAAIVAIPVSAACAIGFNAGLLRFLPRPDGPVRPAEHPYRYSLFALATLLLLAVLQSADVIAGRHYLGAADAGLYAAVSLSGRVVFFATTSLTFFLFPIFSERQERGSDGRGTLLGGLAVVGVITALMVCAFVVSPELWVHLLFGDRFGASVGYIWPMGIAFGLYGAAYLTAMYLLSQRRHVGLGILGSVALLQLGGFYVFHGSIDRLIAVEIAVFAIALVSLVYVAFGGSPRRRATLPVR